MSNVFTEAIASCNSIPNSEDTTKILNFFTDFIKEYGLFLKESRALTFKFLITGFSNNGFKIILKPSDERYGIFSSELTNTPFGRIGVVNLLRHYGAKVIYDDNASKFDNTYEHYLVEFTITE